jgi:hypothetical protein
MFIINYNNLKLLLQILLQGNLNSIKLMIGNLWKNVNYIAQRNLNLIIKLHGNDFLIFYSITILLYV